MGENKDTADAKAGAAEKTEKSALVEEEDYGKPVKYDPNFKGPINNRGCTDIICCLVFTICFVGFLGVGVLAYVRGDPERLLFPTDSNGNLCGVNEFKNKPNLFFFDLIECAKLGPNVAITGCLTPQVCVDTCPTSTWFYLDLTKSEDKRKEEAICKDGTNRALKTMKQLVDDDDCAAYHIPSEPLVNRCVPQAISKIVDAATDVVELASGEVVKDKYNGTIIGSTLEESTGFLATALNAVTYGVKVYKDLRASWHLILVALCIAMLVSFLWIILMRWIAGIIVWLTIILFIALFGFGTYYTINKYFELKDTKGDQEVEFKTNLDYWKELQHTWLALGIICGVVLLVMVLMILFLFNRIRIAISIIKEASRAVGSMMFTLIFPIFPFLLQIVACVYWGASALYLASMGSNEFNAATNESEYRFSNGSIKSSVTDVLQQIPCDTGNTTSGEICQFLKFGGDQYTIYLQFFQLFMWLWVLNFIVAFTQMTLAGAFASYFWAFNKPQDIPAFPIMKSMYRSLRYHLGTLAFGSFIIAVVQMIRLMLEYVDQKLKGKENQLVRFLVKCLKCCFWCLEKFLKFVNKNAYVMCAIYGGNFCMSAKKAFMLIMRNIVRVVVIDKVTDFVLFISKLFVTGVVGIFAFKYLNGDFIEYMPDELVSDFLSAQLPNPNYMFVPVACVIIGSYIIAEAFFSVYDMAVDTLFLCFLEDLERNDGSAEKPYYMSKDLMSILGKKKKVPTATLR